ncbi:MAG TPA: hypothetical protein VFA65_15305 [Bryobacteraceae bacterium]|nr:hypothetical protein [Bryobacteraceae bacterium]
MIRRSGREIVLAFAVIGAALYSCFLPLWEGFDEPFHYAYVQSLSTGHQFPVLGRATISDEIYQSFNDVPLPRLLSVTLPGTLSFEDWFHVSTEEKSQRVARLKTVSPELRYKQSNLQNYEAQQAPLAYLLLTPFDIALSHLQLRWRILMLRLIVSVATALLLYFVVRKLSVLLNVTGPFALATLSCVFASQMLWATIAHVGNDWLSVPLTLCFLTWLIAFTKSHGSRDLLILAVLLSLGLLTKAYFLTFAPVFLARLGVQLIRRKSHAAVWLALLIPVVTAIPWYIHNEFLYGSFTGTQQAVAGIGPKEALSAFPQIPWLSSTLAFLHWSLWTGNWSFLAFSKTTLNVQLILIGAALVLFFARFRQFTEAEWWGIAACACFIAGLVYQTCVTYVHTQGASLFAEPWYWQGIVCFLWVLGFKGLEQNRGVGRVLAALTVLVTGWVAFVTYVAKLFPLYGGGFQRATLTRVWAWWFAHPTQDLRSVTLAPVSILYILLTLFLLLLAVQTALIIRGFSRSGR